ncbi:para-aminobenzoate synthase component I [Neokomagataea thailandica NBRC 106555]|uniref:Para-aminobenzoate synthase component I n=1 Tax=Neokomagataea thailandica NBRC 106555 TaxID=1223520 RepID=A0ABQ0QS33_9PROT|nr:anthranilate synthase component I family protein [Neokomagataea tanensis]GBR54812.1 para-aminobenzoate synthase component I [Neokomagataea thailandica NBRC 106555]
MLDSGGDPKDNRARWAWLCLKPRHTFIVNEHGLLVDNQLHEQDFWLTAQQIQGRSTVEEQNLQAHTGLPFTGGLIGVASYSAGLQLEGVPSRHSSKSPQIIAADYTNVIAYDRQSQRCWWISQNGDQPPNIPATPPQPVAPKLTFSTDFSQEEWIETVQKVRQHIEAGDIFQANLTTRYIAELPVDFDELGAYMHLRALSPAPFGAYFKTPLLSLLSASVERFLALSSDGIVETRPIKGTAPAINDLEIQAAKLRRDTKENAENLMITDLMRHDLGRICALGSITVPELCSVERFAHVLHLVSCVTGQLPQESNAMELLRATLPPGSVTGAPKHKALQIIDALERSNRGTYCGTLFRIGRDGAMDSSVIIRSAERCGAHLSIGAGGGITWPSDPQKEYAETALKAAALLKAFGE